jgi:hypothetical protein
MPAAILHDISGVDAVMDMIKNPIHNLSGGPQAI